MKYWLNRVCAFLLSITEVNFNLASMYFSGQQQMGQIKCQKFLAKTLIFNTHYNEEKDKSPNKMPKQQEFSHCLIMLPKRKVFLACKSSQQTPISTTQMNSCKTRVCTYCLCSPGVHQCVECFGYHLACTKKTSILV